MQLLPGKSFIINAFIIYGIDDSIQRRKCNKIMIVTWSL